MPPPRTIPTNLKQQFSLNNQIDITYSYVDNSTSKALYYSSKTIEKTRRKFNRRELGHYRGIDNWLYQALDKYPIKSQKTSIMGSANQGFGPWYECMAAEFGSVPITVEYNRVNYQHPFYHSIHPSEAERLINFFDSAISISSFEHDGLGRYGDPLNPTGDINAMKKLKQIVKPNGLLYLSVPLGKDKVVFNEHRIYERVRLPMLLQDWKLIDTFGYEEKLLDRDTGNGWEPVTTPKCSSKPTLLHPDFPEYGPILILANI